ncbi:uncharacterized protein AB675_1172 [Cyphellophora attinorum]|uniref:BTB domain-containing protein n=1 Tax=Cyphellophora attinorum TaxID=1664694 RepID=A0A0N1H8E6_9EURO|nr:uncharacterized protein AB675_1172 [Phialophora attinorum]KPI38175.1 hypothetical protein AB675_1172 [Phialophora attinorum]
MATSTEHESVQHTDEDSQTKQPLVDDISAYANESTDRVILQKPVDLFIECNGHLFGVHRAIVESHCDPFDKVGNTELNSEMYRWEALKDLLIYLYREDFRHLLPQDRKPNSSDFDEYFWRLVEMFVMADKLALRKLVRTISHRIINMRDVFQARNRTAECKGTQIATYLQILGLPQTSTVMELQERVKSLVIGSAIPWEPNLLSLRIEPDDATTVNGGRRRPVAGADRRAELVDLVRREPAAALDLILHLGNAMSDLQKLTLDQICIKCKVKGLSMESKSKYQGMNERLRI